MRRGFLTVALALALLLPGLNAAPIEPDLETLLGAQPASVPLMPARAGWNGPEIKRPDVRPNMVLETYGQAATARAVRASLWAAAVPDPRIALALTALILLLRRLRIVREQQAATPAPVPVRFRLPEAA